MLPRTRDHGRQVHQGVRRVQPRRVAARARHGPGPPQVRAAVARPPVPGTRPQPHRAPGARAQEGHPADDVPRPRAEAGGQAAARTAECAARGGKALTAAAAGKGTRAAGEVRAVAGSGAQLSRGAGVLGAAAGATAAAPAAEHGAAEHAPAAPLLLAPVAAARHGLLLRGRGGRDGVQLGVLAGGAPGELQPELPDDVLRVAADLHAAPLVPVLLPGSGRQRGHGGEREQLAHEETRHQPWAAQGQGQVHGQDSRRHGTVTR